MRTAVISDIHGNLEAFQSVLEDIQTRQVDGIISLGDNISYGADSEKVIQLLIANNIPTVLGNHDAAALNENIFKWYREEVKKAVEIAISSLSKESIAYLKKSKVSLSKGGCFFVHGFPPDSFRQYLHQASDKQIEQAFEEMHEMLCFVGHTHRLSALYYENKQVFTDKMDRELLNLDKNKKYIINAGSVGQPRDGSKKAKYVIWDSKTYRLEIRAVDYDFAAAAQKIMTAGIPKRFAYVVNRDLLAQ